MSLNAAIQVPALVHCSWLRQGKGEGSADQGLMEEQCEQAAATAK